MHYYQFNIGDYTSHTRGLSLMEDLAYRRLLDAYYINERPFNGCSTDVAREIGMREYAEEVEYVLDKFFSRNSEGEWLNKRAQKEINKYKKRKDAAKAAGEASGKARKNKGFERSFNDCSTDAEPTNNQEPLTSAVQKPLNANTSANAEEGKTSVLPPKVNGCPYQEIVNLYHEKLPMLPKIRMLSDARKKSIRARWVNELPDLETWGKYFTDVAKSPFLIGRVDPGPGRRQFLADIDFLIRPSTVVKMCEGKYHRK